MKRIRIKLKQKYISYQIDSRLSKKGDQKWPPETPPCRRKTPDRCSSSSLCRKERGRGAWMGGPRGAEVYCNNSTWGQKMPQHVTPLRHSGVTIMHWENYISISFHIINPLYMIVLWCTGGFRAALNWVPMMPRHASLSDSYTSDRCCFWEYTDSWEHADKTSISFPFKLSGIWSWGQFSFRFWTKWKTIWFKIERKTVTTIISHSLWKEMEI